MTAERPDPAALDLPGPDAGRGSDATSSAPVSVALAAWAASPGGRKVLAEARRRIEAGSALAAGSLRVELAPDERRDVGKLLGLPWATSTRPVPVVALHSALAERGVSLRQLLEADGPLRDRSAERRSATETAAAERDGAVAVLVAAGIVEDVAAWALARRGFPKPGTGGLVALAQDAARVWAAAPGGGSQEPVLLAVLASEVFGDPHALDRNTDRGRLVARLALGSSGPRLEASSAALWRSAWASLGVVCDAVSSLVLTLNLALTGDGAAAQLTAVAGEPVWLSLRALRGAWGASRRDVWVCENPSVVEAAADRLGVRCPPLICTYGQPTSAAIELVRRLAEAGVVVHVRADSDAAGMSIVAQLRQAAPSALLWRYDMRSSAVAAAHPSYEEELLEQLLGDLEAAS